MKSRTSATGRWVVGSVVIALSLGSPSCGATDALREHLRGAGDETAQPPAPARRRVATAEPPRSDAPSADTDAPPALGAPAGRPDRVQTTTEGDWQRTLLVGMESLRAEQETPFWCWAACAQMVFHFNGDTSVTQDEIAKRVHGEDEHGELRVETASRYEVMCALDPDFEPVPFDMLWGSLEARLTSLKLDRSRIGFEVGLDAGSFGRLALDEAFPDRSVSIDDLRNGHPMVVALRNPGSKVGHAYVLYGAEYRERDRSLPGSGIIRGVIDAVGELDPEGAQRVAENLEQSGDQLADAVDQIPAVDASAYEIRELQLIDPWDASTLTLPFAEFDARVDFTLSATTARRNLEDWHGLLRLETTR